MIFFRTKFQDILLRKKVIENKELINIFRKKIYLNEALDEEINHRINGIIDNFVTILIVGAQGTIKSSVGQNKAFHIDPSIKADKNIFFVYEAFRNALANSQPKQTFILDEQIFLHGIGSVRIINEVQGIIETLRKRQNSMILIGVEDKYFPEEVFTFVFETVDNAIMGVCKDNDIEHEIRTCAFNDEHHHSPKRIFVRLLIKKMGHYAGLYVEEIIWNNSLWQEYKIIKDEFVEKAKMQDFAKLDYEKVANELLKERETSFYNSLKDLMLLLEKKFPNITVDEKELIARQIIIFRKERSVE